MLSSCFRSNLAISDSQGGGSDPFKLLKIISFNQSYNVMLPIKIMYFLDNLLEGGSVLL